MARRKQKFKKQKSAAGKTAVRGEGKQGRKGCLGAAKKPIRHLQPSFKAGAWHSTREDGWVHDQAELSSPLPGTARLSSHPALLPEAYSVNHVDSQGL